MARMVVALLIVLIALCIAAPEKGTRYKKHAYEYGHGGYSAGHGGYGTHGFGSHGYGGASVPITQSFSQSQSKASASSSSVGGTVAG